MLSKEEKASVVGATVIVVVGLILYFGLKLEFIPTFIISCLIGAIVTFCIYKAMVGK
jgi:hypothetical protein